MGEDISFACYNGESPFLCPSWGYSKCIRKYKYIYNDQLDVNLKQDLIAGSCLIRPWHKNNTGLQNKTTRYLHLNVANLITKRHIPFVAGFVSVKLYLMNLLPIHDVIMSISQKLSPCDKILKY